MNAICFKLDLDLEAEISYNVTILTEGEAIRKLGEEADLAASQKLGRPELTEAGMVVHEKGKAFVRLTEQESINVQAAIAAWNNVIQAACRPADDGVSPWGEYAQSE